jgi:hypothetical protein
MVNGQFKILQLLHCPFTIVPYKSATVPSRSFGFTCGKPSATEGEARRKKRLIHILCLVHNILQQLSMTLITDYSPLTIHQLIPFSNFLQDLQWQL